jgi:hypothetical protein
MSEINYYKFFVLCSGDVAADVDHLHVKKIHLKVLVGNLYIVRDDLFLFLRKRCNHLYQSIKCAR